MSPCPIPLSAVSENLRKHVDPKAPVPLRIMASRGMVPMPPRDMVTVLTCLSFDDDEKVKAGAVKSLSELPERMVMGALQEELHPLVLDHLVRTQPPSPQLWELVLLNQKTPDETFEYLADKAEGNQLDIVFNNQVRILRHPPIARALLRNAKASKSTIDMLMDFAVRTGMDFSGLEAFEESKKRVGSAPRDFKEEARIQQVVVASLPEEMLKEEGEALTPEEREAQDKLKEGVLKKLHQMTAAQKVALAQKGNKVVRMALIRDSNRVVAVAAVKNPGIGESEIAGVVSSRAVCDDVLRIICNNREWTRSYTVKLALINNPKTPLAFSMRFLQSIQSGDLKGLVNNKNIPNALANAAKEMLTKRKAGR